MLTLSARDAAVAIWPSMARALLKYLRVTRQTHLYRQSDLLEHLQSCITLNFTPRAFLEKFLKPEPVVTDQNKSNSWELISNFVPNRPLQVKNSYFLILPFQALTDIIPGGYGIPIKTRGLFPDCVRGESSRVQHLGETLRQKRQVHSVLQPINGHQLLSLRPCRQPKSQPDVY